MKAYIKDKKHIVIIAILALIHMLITIITDKNIFIFPEMSSSGYGMAVFDYWICKLLTLLVLYGFYYCLYLLISPNRKETILYKVIITALPYLLVILAVSAIKLPQGYLSNDEYAIYNDAVNLTHSTWFCILTPYFYTVSLMLMPFKYAPIIFKLIIEYLVIGYVVLRCKNHYGKKIGCIMYALFLMYPVIAYTTSAHRLPIYFLLYLFLFTKLYFDFLEGVTLTYPQGLWMLTLSAVLTQWRTEGIYLSVLVPILMFIVYKKSFEEDTLKKSAIYIVMAIVLQFVIAYPQNAFMGAKLDDAANDRMKPFYAYTITNMYRNGLDFEKNKADLEIVDKYLSLEVIEAINEHYQDINYEDVLILYQDGFVGVREEAGVEEFINYSDALKRIFVNNLDVFAKTRIGAFCYAALPYHIERNSGIVSLLISLVKSLFYNLFIPLTIVVILLICSLVKRNWFNFFVAGGLLCHWFIVFILAPASYFKYYFPIYIMAYFYVFVCIMKLLTKMLSDKTSENNEIQ